MRATHKTIAETPYTDEDMPAPRDDAYAERTEDDFGSVDDPYPDDFTDYYRAIELEGAL